MKATVKFAKVVRDIPASKTFASLLAARAYEMEYPDFAAQIYVNGVAFDATASEYIDLADGDITEAELVKNYVERTKLSDSEIRSLEAAV